MKIFREIGLGKLYVGDSLELMKSMSDDSVDLILTDPPYGIDLKYDIYNDSEENWNNLMSSFIPESQRVSTMTIFPCCRIVKLEWIYNNFPPDWLGCWYKGSTGHRAFIGFNDWEPMLFYGKNKGISMHDYIKVSPNERMGKYKHPCPKPLEWASWFIHRTTKEGMTVFDPFVGSGTTIIACEKMNKR